MISRVITEVASINNVPIDPITDNPVCEGSSGFPDFLWLRINELRPQPSIAISDSGFLDDGYKVTCFTELPHFSLTLPSQHIYEIAPHQ